MAEYAIWQSTIVDDAGNIVPGASVEVRREIPGQPLAVLFSDREGLVPIVNPTAADAEGFVKFHAAGGAFKITATSGAFERIWRYVAIGRAAERDLTSVVGASGVFEGDGTTTAFDLTFGIGSAASMLWVESGVPQRPGIDFTISGSVVNRVTAPLDGAIISWWLFGGVAEVDEFDLKVDRAGDVMTGPLTLHGNAASALHAVPKQQLDAAIATEVTNRNTAITAAVVGLFDDRGNYDASVNTFPASGGSGTAGAILKGDIWTVSVVGTLGGVAVGLGDTVRAIVDTPGQTAANWAVAETNIGFVPENVANKDTDGTMAANSAIKYPAQSAVVTYVAAAVAAALAAVRGGVSASFDTLAEIVAGFIPNSLLTTRGDIIYRNATVPARLPKGNLGDVLTQGADDPEWAAASGGALTAARTYYVRTDGSDSNTGLVDSAGGAFLTRQKAVDVVASLNMATYQVTIQVRDGTYTDTTVLRPYVGQLAPIIQGNSGTPANVLVSVTSGDCFSNDGGRLWQINDMELRTTTSGRTLYATNFGSIYFSNLRFGACATFHQYSNANATIKATGNYAVTGNAQIHACATGWIILAGRTITYSNSPVFSNSNFFGGRGGIIEAHGMTFTNGGTVTGKRFHASDNCVIFVDAAGANYVPGNVAGTTATGGQYT